MIIIGEKINGSIPSVAEAIAKRDAEFIKQRARIQDEAGATFIDCCASVPEAEEVETLKWMIDCIQEVSDLPISIDTPGAGRGLQILQAARTVQLRLRRRRQDGHHLPPDGREQGLGVHRAVL